MWTPAQADAAGLPWALAVAPEARAETRALQEESPEQGTRTIHDARFVSEPLWQEWGGRLE